MISDEARREESHDELEDGYSKREYYRQESWGETSRDYSPKVAERKRPRVTFPNSVETNDRAYESCDSRRVSPTKSCGKRISCPSSPTDDNFDNLSRSERKRRREMKRRLDINREYDGLQMLLSRMNPPELHETNDVIHTEASAAAQVATLNRVDLMNKTVLIMERLFEENKKMRRQVQELKLQISKSKVLMMFPMMVPSDANVQNGCPLRNDAIPLNPIIPPEFRQSYFPSPTLYFGPHIPPPPHSFLKQQFHLQLQQSHNYDG